MSKDDRIDLTQFEGTTEGPWNMDELGEIWRAVPLDAEPYCVMSFYHHPSIKPSEADLRLMAAGPTLVAELKRCYERETELLAALQVIKEYINESQSMDNIKDFVNNVCDTNLPYWGCACQGPHTGPC